MSQQHPHVHGPQCGHAHPETVRRTTDKVGRNDPCPCGSGKKHKKCCLSQAGA